MKEFQGNSDSFSTCCFPSLLITLKLHPSLNVGNIDRKGLSTGNVTFISTEWQRKIFQSGTKPALFELASSPRTVDEYQGEAQELTGNNCYIKTMFFWAGYVVN